MSCLKIALSIVLGMINPLFSIEKIELDNLSDRPMVVDVDSFQTAGELLEFIDEYFSTSTFDSFEEQEQSTVLVTLMRNDQSLIFAKQQVNAAEGRNYNQKVTRQEKQDMLYIINSLSRESLVSLGTMKSSLKKAGNRIDHIHPLRFLMTIFSDEELKAGIHGIKGRGGMVWNEFSSGLFATLSEEKSKNNLKDEYILDFSTTLGISKHLIIPSIQASRWNELLDKLIDNLPRDKDPNRYNM